GSPLVVGGNRDCRAAIDGQTACLQVEVIASRTNHPGIGILPVVNQVQPPCSNTRICYQYSSVLDDVVTDPHITEAWTAAPTDIYGGRIDLVEDVIGDVGIRDGHTVQG